MNIIILAIIGVVVLLAVLLVFCPCMLSSQISRDEEAREGR